MKDTTNTNARALADACLGYLAENPDELAGFLDQSGFRPDQLRAAIGSRELTAGLLDHFAANEAILLAFCANSGTTPEAFMHTWQQMNPHQ